MSAVGTFDQFFIQKYIFRSALGALALCCASLGVTQAQAEPTASEAALALAADGGGMSMEELRQHAATIDDILETASERVERLAAAEDVEPRLVEAIRQELSLSRRWNRHLEKILLDVAKARRVLGKREREAAKEIVRMTAVAEEARLELIELKRVLKRHPAEEEQNLEKRSEGSLDNDARAGFGDQMASSRAIIDAAVKGAAGPQGDVLEARAMLASMQDAQKSAARDVDAVRAKIIDALQTLASVRGDLPVGARGVGADLSSEDITGWAASVATRLNRDSSIESE